MFGEVMTLSRQCLTLLDMISLKEMRFISHFDVGNRR